MWMNEAEEEGAFGDDGADGKENYHQIPCHCYQIQV